MKEASWTDIAQLIGIIAIVVSLIFVGLQLRQSQQLGYSEILANFNDRKAAVSELLTDHAEIWHKACSGDVLDESSKIIARVLFDAVLRDVYLEYVAYDIGIASSDSAKRRLIEGFAARLWKYPGMKQMFDSSRSWHQGTVESVGISLAPGLMSGIVDRLEELESSDKEPIMDTAFCGM